MTFVESSTHSRVQGHCYWLIWFLYWSQASSLLHAWMCSCRPWDDEHSSLLLLKPRSPSIAIFLGIVSEKGIATSETQKPTRQLHTIYSQDTGKLAPRTGFDGCHPSHQLEFLALGEDCQAHVCIIPICQIGWLAVVDPLTDVKC
jgi:hypothetical protein